MTFIFKVQYLAPLPRAHPAAPGSGFPRGGYVSNWKVLDGIFVLFFYYYYYLGAQIETPVPFANTRARRLDINNSMIKKLTEKTVDEDPAFCQYYLKKRDLIS